MGRSLLAPPLEAWCTELDADGSGSVTQDDFLHACKKLGMAGPDARKIFHWIDFDRSGVITLDELDEEANQAFMRGERTTAPVDDRKKTEMPFYERQISIAMKRHAAEQRESARRDWVGISRNFSRGHFRSGPYEVDATGALGGERK